MKLRWWLVVVALAVAVAVWWPGPVRAWEAQECGDSEDCVLSMACEDHSPAAYECYVFFDPLLNVDEGDVFATSLQCPGLRMEDPCDNSGLYVPSAGSITAGASCPNVRASYVVKCDPGNYGAVQSLSITRYISPTPTPTPVPTSTVGGGGEYTFPVNLPYCALGQVRCTAQPPAQTAVYANGLYVGGCDGEWWNFPTRNPYSSTVVIFNDAAYAAEIEAEVVCGMVAQQSVAPTVVVSATLISPTVVNLGTVGSGSGFRNLLPDFESNMDLTFSWARRTIDLVNMGNLLYVLTAIGLAAMVLRWMIHQVQHPRSW